MLFKLFDTKTILKWGILSGLAEAAYCFSVAFFMDQSNNFLSRNLGGYFGIMFMLLLLVFSEAVSGVFVFGYPFYLTVQKRYKEAAATVAVSITTIFIALLIFILFILIIK